MSTRRQFLISLSGALLASPLTVLAQTPAKVWRVGFLLLRTANDKLYPVLTRTLRELGYVKGKNLIIEWRFAGGKYELLPELAAELVKLNVDVMVTEGTPGTVAAQSATRTIPIAFFGGSDVVADGLVKSLARPGGNTTGITYLYRDSLGKELELLLSMVPGLSRLAVLTNPDNPAMPANVKALQATGQTSNVQVLPVDARTPQEIDNAFSWMIEQRSEALIWLVDSFLDMQSRQIADLAVKHRLPSSSGWPTYADDGGLMGYGVNRTEVYRQVAGYVDKILKGAKPGELPVQQPTKFDLAINRKTARELGLTIPPELLVLADKVID